MVYPYFPVLTHQPRFFHSALVTPVYGEKAVVDYSFEYYAPATANMIMLGSLFIYAIVLLNCRNLAKLVKPVVQNMTHMIVGLFGMILSVWSMMASFIMMDFKFDLALCGIPTFDFRFSKFRIRALTHREGRELICPCIHIYLLTILFQLCTIMLYTSSIALCICYLPFCSALTTLYIRLPAENMSFSGVVKFHVVFFSLLHLGVAVAVVYLTVIVSGSRGPSYRGLDTFFQKTWLICLLLIGSSFIFCCDAWSCIVTGSYMLCEHREEKYEMRTKNPIDGIIYNVAVRRFFKKSKQTCPDGFQFDDYLIVEDKWLMYDATDVKICFWT
ncbi:hypothetical protein CAEBREN_11423 [Caenorhabditis brenneri]|uniref:Uncharacterized protein n=1 Tax=Caenorhabditis brenneri TaxID=135651 RepID=G0NIL8_CAEBE|nr:hypothetical protein CAEBREN_11423 [Caenorhabditis brenneri]